MTSFPELQEKFESYLKAYRFPDSPKKLYDSCTHILSIGGKRVRPVLSLMAHEIFKPLNKNAEYAALAIEIFHNFTLVHDDIMDRAKLRRGKMTVHEKYDVPTAILAGDVLSIHAYECLNKMEHPKKDETIALFNQTAIEICEGQQMDMDFEERDDVSLEDYVQMIGLKTSVLLACGLKMGAFLADASDEDATHLYEFGKNVGIAFQLQDDYLDAFGDEAKTGKKSGGDILMNKKTVLHCQTLTMASAEQAGKYHRLCAEAGEAKIQGIKDLMQETGATTFTKERIEHFTQEGFRHLEKVSASAEQKEPLRSLAMYLLKREA